jgi:hypothetical protein
MRRSTHLHQLCNKISSTSCSRTNFTRGPSLTWLRHALRLTQLHRVHQNNPETCRKIQDHALFAISCLEAPSKGKCGKGFHTLSRER